MDGLARVVVRNSKDERLQGFIDKTGNMVIEPRFFLGGDFSEGLANVSEGDMDNALWGYIDKTGAWVIKPQFQGLLGANPFSEGLAAVKKDGKFGYIDKSGKWIIEPQFDYAHDFARGLAKVDVRDPVTGETHEGYIDKTGEWVWLQKH